MCNAESLISALESELAEVKELLRSVEWSGRNCFNGGTVPACPVCHGYDTRHHASTCVVEEARGHRTGCRLEAALDATSK